MQCSKQYNILEYKKKVAENGNTELMPKYLNSVVKNSVEVLSSFALLDSSRSSEEELQVD